MFMEVFLERLLEYLLNIGTLLADPLNIVILFASVLMGILFGAMPGLTATLGVALLTTLTYGFATHTALVALLGVYIGGVYGGSYASILLNIPGTAAAAATAVDGYPLAVQGKGGETLGLTTTASFIGTLVGMLFVVAVSPLIAAIALQFTSYEFFLLAFFGIIISGTLQSADKAYKGWIAGFIGLFLAVVGRDRLQFFPRFTFGISQLDSGIEVVPVLIGAFGIPQIMQVLRDKFQIGESQEIGKITPRLGTLFRYFPHVLRSSAIGVGIGSVPGIGEDIAGWVSYGAAKNSSDEPEKFGTGRFEAVVSTETANNSCIGGAMVPLLNLGIPGSPPAAMLLGALLLHGINPGPMITLDHPGFILQVVAIMTLGSLGMLVVGLVMAKQVVKLLRVPVQLFMPIIAVLCVIGSYALGTRVFNLWLMLPVGILAYFLTEMKYPIAPLVIGVILGPMADENLRRALMVSHGSFLPVFTRPVALILFLVIVFTVTSQTPLYRRMRKRISRKRNGGEQ